MSICLFDLNYLIHWFKHDAVGSLSTGWCSTFFIFIQRNLIISDENNLKYESLIWHCCSSRRAKTAGKFKWTARWLNENSVFEGKNLILGTFPLDGSLDIPSTWQDPWNIQTISPKPTTPHKQSQPSNKLRWDGHASRLCSIDSPIRQFKPKWLRESRRICSTILQIIPPLKPRIDVTDTVWHSFGREKLCAELNT